MSASEKLKARLYPVLDRPKLTLAESAAIIAVVEAAERARCEHDLQAGDCTKRDIAAGRACERCSALAALDEALGKEA